MPDPWEQFCVGNPRRGRGFEPTCLPFGSVTHTTHVRFGLDVLRDQVLRPRLVFDESILNDKRILVNWVSPNHWTLGFRYGNVSLRFPLNTILQDASVYWVDSITRYNPPAIRYLVSSQDRALHGGLTKVDLTQKTGPWWHDTATDTHYYNGTYCLEIMVERELTLADCTAVDFVTHHESFCSVFPASPARCSELGIDNFAGAERFLCGVPILAAAQAPAVWNLVDRNFREGIWERVRDAARNQPCTGASTANSPAGRAAARAALLARHLRDIAAFREAISIFVSPDEASEALATLFEATFGIQPQTLLR